MLHHDKLLQSALTTAFTLCLLLLLGGSAQGVDPSRPNIVIIYADDLGYGDVGCYNSESKVPTPHLDRLASQGVRFTDAHSAATVCTPSRYGIMTGRMPFRLNYRGVFTGVEGPCLITEDRLTLGGMLRDAGYTTAMFGKWHIGLTFLDKDGQPVQQTSKKRGNELVQHVDFSKPIPDGPVNRGFDHFFGTACCPTTDWLYAWIDGDRVPVPPTKVRDRTHLPLNPYTRDFRAGLVAPDFDFEEVDMKILQKSQQFLKHHVETAPEKPFFLFHSTQAVHLPSLPGRAFKGKTNAGPHGDFIFEFDHIVGEITKTLDELGVAENTLLIVTSDNGPEIAPVVNMRANYKHDGARPWRGIKRDQWEGGHRVPFIVRWPGKVAKGSLCDHAICQTDIMNTFAAITKTELPDNAAEDSFSFLPAMLNDSDEAPRPYILHQTMNLSLAIRKGKWKYLDHQGSGGNNYASRPNAKPGQWGYGLDKYALPESAPQAPGQLFDLKSDPGETKNLYFERPDIVKELKDLLEETKQSGRSR